MEPAKILVIEDDYIVARTIERSLRRAEFQVTLASRGDKGLAIAREGVIANTPPDLVILDIIMPDMDGYAVCKEMRRDADLAQIPILFLTARVKPQDRIQGLSVGADDYLCKPFNVDELILRVQAILRRTYLRNKIDQAKRTVCVQEGAKAPTNQRVKPGISHCLAIGDFILDTQSYELHTPQRGIVRLTPLQFDLLYHLMTHAGEAFSPARLLDEVWDYPAGRGSPDLVRVHIKTLRERVETDPQTPTFIRTVPGRGYTVDSIANVALGLLHPFVS
jgi:DNA-binding response OmpR family regulator